MVTKTASRESTSYAPDLSYGKLKLYNMLSPLLLLAVAYPACSFVAQPRPHNGIFASTVRQNTRQLFSPDDSAETAEPLPLTPDDLRRLESMRTRHCTIPIMILDALLPKQKLSFQSNDPRVRRLVDYCIKEGVGQLGMIGLNPHTGRPLSRGVTVSVSEDTVVVDGSSIAMTVTGKKRMELQGEPWLDPSGSFYLAEIEIMEERVELMTEEQEGNVEKLSQTLPEKIQEWVGWVIKANAADEKGMKARMKDLGPMPNDPTERALWVAALVNPLPKLDVCLEIRPAMLSCSNDYDRMVLACQAVESSINHLNGKQRLF